MIRQDQPEHIWQDQPDYIWQAGSEVDPELDMDLFRSFAQQWGDPTIDALKQALQEGENNLKLFAMTALGLVEDSGVDPLLIPFLHSETYLERWYATIALGRHKNEHAFSLVQDLLTEGLENTDGTNDQASYLEYLRLMWRRCSLALILGSWGRPQAASALRHAFSICWKIEQHSGGEERRDFLDIWHRYQNHLAYALGQLGAWGACTSLDLPPRHLHVTIIYMALGSLQIDPKLVFHSVFSTYLFIKTFSPLVPYPC